MRHSRSSKRVLDETSDHGTQRPSHSSSRPKPRGELQSPVNATPIHLSLAAPVNYDNRVANLQQAYGNQAILRTLRHQPASTLGIQARLTIGQPNDLYEQEADFIADQITGRSAAAPVIRNETEKATYLHPKAATHNSLPVIPAIEGHLQSLQGGGQPLPPATRRFFESRFGTDLSQVRIHTDTEAAETAQLIRSQAFTTGHQIVFGRGYYAPETPQGQWLLAHELTHVVQQGKASLQSPSHLQNGVPNLQKEQATPIEAPVTPTEAPVAPTEVPVAPTEAPTAPVEVPAGQMSERQAVAWLEAEQISYTPLSAGRTEFSPAIRIDFSQVMSGFQLYYGRNNPSNVHPVTPRLAVALVRLIRFLSSDGVTILHHLGVSGGTHAAEGYCIDIAGFTFNDGTTIMLDRNPERSAFFDTTTRVPTGENASEYMRKVGNWMVAHDFGQVIGPGIGRGGHYDHFHAQIPRGRTLRGFVYKESTAP